MIFELVRALNSSIDAGEVSQADAAAVRDAFAEFDRVLGVLVAAQATRTSGRRCRSRRSSS